MFINRCRSVDCCTVLSGNVSLQTLLLCYNRTGTFLVTGLFPFDNYVRNGSLFFGLVILPVKLSERS